MVRFINSRQPINFYCHHYFQFIHLSQFWFVCDAFEHRFIILSSGSWKNNATKLKRCQIKLRLNLSLFSAKYNIKLARSLWIYLFTVSKLGWHKWTVNHLCALCTQWHEKKNRCEMVHKMCIWNERVGKLRPIWYW